MLPSILINICTSFYLFIILENRKSEKNVYNTNLNSDKVYADHYVDKESLIYDNVIKCM